MEIRLTLHGCHTNGRGHQEVIKFKRVFVQQSLPRCLKLLDLLLLIVKIPPCRRLGVDSINTPDKPLLGHDR